MRTHPAFALLALAFAGPCFAEGKLPLELAPVYLSVGEQRLLSTPELIRYSPGCDALKATVPPDSPDSLLVRAIRAGVCDLWIWRRHAAPERRPVRIMAWSARSSPSPLMRAAGSLREVEVIAMGEILILRGQFRTLSEAAAVQELVSRFDGSVRDLTQPAPELLQTAEHALRGWSQRLTGDRGALPQVDREGSQLRIYGQPSSPSQASAWEKAARAIWPPLTIEWDQSDGQAPAVFLRAFLLESSDTEALELGVDWPSEAPGALKITRWPASAGFDVEASLRALSKRGKLKVLARPSISVRVPGEALLFSGGEVAYRVRSRHSSEVSWRPHGVSLKIVTSRGGSRGLRLNVATEVSELDPGASGGSELPRLRANRIQTEVDARYGRPLLLSGLSREVRRSGSSGIPFLSDLPLLGPLFGVHARGEERSELLAILIPHRSAPSAPLAKVSEAEFPSGPVPAPRNWLSPQEFQAIHSDPTYPWSAFQ
ncbi:MAG: type II and III secretion system protein [Bdellovibrionales bacterium]|nr:type II and III secretion system protein [Bdellovibrionales bacterium]